MGPIDPKKKKKVKNNSNILNNMSQYIYIYIDKEKKKESILVEKWLQYNKHLVVGIQKAQTQHGVGQL